MASPRNSKDRGDETEITIIHELVSAGYSVSIPFGDNNKYDLIVGDGDALYRIQWKTAWETEEGRIRFNTHSQTTRDGTYHEQTYENVIDAFMVRYPMEEKLFWIDVAEAGRKKMVLRFDAEIDHPSINWAEEYTFDGTIPT